MTCSAILGQPHWSSSFYSRQSIYIHTSSYESCGRSCSTTTICNTYKTHVNTQIGYPSCVQPPILPTSKRRSERVNEVLVLHIGQVEEGLRVVLLDVTLCGILLRLLFPKSLPLVRTFQRVVHNCPCLAVLAATRDVALVEETEVQGLDNDEARKDAKHGEVRLKTR